MANTKYIGGGFPAIRECNDDTNNITKETITKKEFSTKKLIPIAKILSRPTNIKKVNNMSEDLNIIDNNFFPIDRFFHDSYNGNINETIILPKKPSKKSSKKSSKKLSKQSMKQSKKQFKKNKNIKNN